MLGHITSAPTMEILIEIEGTFPRPDTFTGRVLAEFEKLLVEIGSPHVRAILNGKSYKFTKLHADGTFELTLDQQPAERPAPA